jgi:hypothetical protein
MLVSRSPAALAAGALRPDAAVPAEARPAWAALAARVLLEETPIGQEA